MSFDFSRVTKREFNVGNKDQQMRLAGAVGIMIIAAIIENGVLMILGICVAALAFLKWCPIYSGMAKSTVTKGEKPPLF